MQNPDYLTMMQREDALGSADLIVVYEQGIDDLRTAVAGMTAEQVLRRPIPGKWSALEVVAHIADTEIFFTDRIERTTLASVRVRPPFSPRPIAVVCS